MANLSQSQLMELAKSVGFTGNDVNIAAAVALAESGGNPGAHNSTPPDDSYGLWQINMLGAMGPARRKRFGISSNTELFKPAVNAKAAKIIHGESGWKAWTTYTSGKYKQHMSGGTTPNNGTDTPDSSEESLGVLDIPGAIVSASNTLSKAATKATANVAGYLIAGILGVLGVVLLLRNVIPVPPIGKVLKAVKK